MTRIIILQIVAGIFLLCCLPLFTKAGHEKRVCLLRNEFAFISMPVADTLPAPARPTEGSKPAPAVAPITGKPAVAVIKEVPRARKVSIPRQVTVDVKPVKVIKPKIIKPVLKVL